MTTGDSVHCCGTVSQVIDLRGGEEALQMVRCTTCARREWRVGDEPVEVDAAFALLAETYRAVPRAARAARDRAATQTAARTAARAAARDAGAAPQTGGARQEGPARHTGAVDRQELAALLQGWSVLGATG